LLSHIKEITEFICAAFYALSVKPFGRKPRRVVLYYHGVKKADAKGFRKQMAYLTKKCSVVKPSEIKNIYVDGAKTLAAITFDDAFVSVIKNAVPILKEDALPAGFFVPIGSLGQAPCWQMPENCPDRNEMIMSKEQIIELDNDGFEIFSHTFSHPVLTKIPNCMLERELANSKIALEKILGHQVYAISYPHGAHDHRVCDAAKRAGYQLGFTIEPQIVNNLTDDMQIGRFRVSPRDSLLKFKLKVTGAYQATSLLRKIQRSITRLFRYS
jgi:peptidoglycan/xylan/chitin deacetylase (PgdA/CDA1 family)